MSFSFNVDPRDMSPDLVRRVIFAPPFDQLVVGRMYIVRTSAVVSQYYPVITDFIGICDHIDIVSPVRAFSKFSKLYTRYRLAGGRPWTRPILLIPGIPREQFAGMTDEYYEIIVPGIVNLMDGVEAGPLLLERLLPEEALVEHIERIERQKTATLSLQRISQGDPALQGTVVPLRQNLLPYDVRQTIMQFYTPAGKRSKKRRNQRRNRRRKSKTAKK